MKTMMLAIAAAALLAGCGTKSGDNSAQVAGSGAQQVTGAGSTFVYPVMSAWAADYQKQSGTSVNYQSIGSGGGIAQIKAGTVDFGATDQPLDPKELAVSGLAQFPVVIGGVVPVVNIAGIKPGRFVLRVRSLPIFMRAKSKAGMIRPSPASIPDFPFPQRTSRSSTGRRFGHQLQFHPLSEPGQPDVENRPGRRKIRVLAGGRRRKGNEGVAGYVKQISNLIGYVEYAYVLQNNMSYALLQNSAGAFVAPSADSFQAAAASADWKNAEDFFLVMTNAPGANAFPITASTFIVMHKQPKDKARSDAALTFFRWALEHGQPQARKLVYVSLPPDLVQQIHAYIGASIK